MEGGLFNLRNSATEWFIKYISTGKAEKQVIQNT